MCNYIFYLFFFPITGHSYLFFKFIKSKFDYHINLLISYLLWGKLSIFRVSQKTKTKNSLIFHNLIIRWEVN